MQVITKKETEKMAEARLRKRYTANFTLASNTVVRDSSLSWKARGIFIYLWSLPDDWTFYQAEVAEHATDGLTALRSGLDELELAGYLKRSRGRDEKGQLAHSIWQLTDNPSAEEVRQSETPITEVTAEETNNTTQDITNAPDEPLEVNQTEVRSGTSPTLAERFEILWEAYPKKKGKRPAFNSYKKAVRDGVTDQEILAGIQAYEREIKAKKIDELYVKNGSTFFAQRSWLDEFDTKTVAKTNGVGKPTSVGNFRQRDYEEGYFDQFEDVITISG